MSKQTVKVRAKLRKGSLRRKTPAHPPVPAKPDIAHYEEGYHDGWDACIRGARLARGREMIPNDLETPALRWARWEAVATAEVDKPSILSRLKAWWRR